MLPGLRNGLSGNGLAGSSMPGGSMQLGGMPSGSMQLGGMSGSGLVPMQPPADMMPTPGQQEPLAAQGVSGGGVTPQHVQMVGAAIVHYARELGIGEHKIQSFLGRSPPEQVALFRNLHLLVQQARAKQLAGGGGGGSLPLMPPPMPAPAAMVPPPMPAPMMPQPMMPPPMGMAGMGGMGGGLGGGLPPMPLPQRAQAAPPSSQYANMFSEMFD